MKQYLARFIRFDGGRCAAIIDLVVLMGNIFCRLMVETILFPCISKKVASDFLPNLRMPKNV